MACLSQKKWVSPASADPGPRFHSEKSAATQQPASVDDFVVSGILGSDNHDRGGGAPTEQSTFVKKHNAKPELSSPCCFSQRLIGGAL
jgi:hypothetical protein